MPFPALPRCFPYCVQPVQYCFSTNLNNSRGTLSDVLLPLAVSPIALATSDVEVMITVAIDIFLNLRCCPKPMLFRPFTCLITPGVLQFNTHFSSSSPLNFDSLRAVLRTAARLFLRHPPSRPQFVCTLCRIYMLLLTTGSTFETAMPCKYLGICIRMVAFQEPFTSAVLFETSNIKGC